MTNQIIKTAQALLKIKGMEKSPFVLVELFDATTGESLNKINVNNRRKEVYPTSPVFYLSGYGPCKESLVGPWLNNSSFDGDWSSAKIREGLGIQVQYDYSLKAWVVSWHKYFKQLSRGMIALKTDNEGFAELLSDPAADDLANILGIIEYHKQFSKEVEDYLEKIKA